MLWALRLANCIGLIEIRIRRLAPGSIWWSMTMRDHRLIREPRGSALRRSEVLLQQATGGPDQADAAVIDFLGSVLLLQKRVPIGPAV
jgi:hypothetical protein